MIIPTDTCYGLAGELNSQDYHEIYRLKGREFAKPLAILVRDYADMDTYIEISAEQKQFLQEYPFPWSFVGKKREGYMLLDCMDESSYTKISLRVAECCIPEDIRDRLQYPLFLTSANLSGQKESTSFEQAKNCFPGIIGYDGGVCDQSPSDIFSIGEDGELVYLRRNYGDKV